MFGPPCIAETPDQVLLARGLLSEHGSDKRNAINELEIRMARLEKIMSHQATSEGNDNMLLLGP